MTPITLATTAPLSRWVGWRNQTRNGKTTKMPFAPLTGKAAKADDPAGWADRPEAEAWARVHVNGGGGGVGLELGPVEGEDYSFGGVDLDTCRDPATGLIEPWASEVIERINSYTEVSPSGTGLKVFLRYRTADIAALRRMMSTDHGKQFKRGTGEHPPAIELHISHRYFAVTDQRRAETPNDLRLVSLDTLTWLLTEVGPAFKRGGTGQAEFQSPPPADQAKITGRAGDQNASFDHAADADTLLVRLHKAMRRKPALAARWNGSAAGLQDTSRSGMDMSMTALMKHSGFSYGDTRALLSGWPHGAGAEHVGDERYFRRMWERGVTLDGDTGVLRGEGQRSMPQSTGTTSEAAGDDTEPWPEPVDFLADSDLTGAPVLRPEHLPEALFPFVADTATRMGVDPASVALTAVVACASVANDTWQIQPKQRDDTWTESPRLWGAIVGDPSILKSPVIKACTHPIDVLEEQARRRHAVALHKHKADLKAWKDAGSDPADEPKAPRLERYMVESTTIEALSEALRDDLQATQCAPAGKILIRQDEMGEFFANLDRYRGGGKGGGDRGAYLRLYNGGRYTVDRVGRGTFAVPNWSACFVGGVQPGPIQQIAREAADDGLLQRFCYCVPARQERGEDRRPDRSAIDRYKALFPALVALYPPSATVARQRLCSGGPARAVVLHADAHRHRHAVDNLAEVMMAMPDISHRLKSAFGKWAGVFARLALTFHLIEAADANARGSQAPTLSVLSEANAHRVSNYMRDILLPHLLRADAVMFATTQTGHARWIAGFILAKAQPRVTLRDVVQAYSPLRAPESRRELLEVMESLVTVGWLQPERQINPARPPSAWAVNPTVHTVFAAQAERERGARGKARQRIAETVAAVRERR